MTPILTGECDGPITTCLWCRFSPGVHIDQKDVWREAIWARVADLAHPASQIDTVRPVWRTNTSDSHAG